MMTRVHPALCLMALARLGMPDVSPAQTARACPHIAVRDTLALHAALVAATDPRASLGPAHVVCGAPGLVLAAAWMPGRDDSLDYGPRLVLARSRPSHRYTLAYVSPGLRDAKLPELRLFQVGRRVLILVDLGNEGSWGLGTYELRGSSLRDLGQVDVGLPPRSQEDPAGSAMHLAVPRMTPHGWQVAFTAVVVESPNQESQRVLTPRPERPIRFQQAQPLWRRVPDR